MRGSAPGPAGRELRDLLQPMSTSEAGITGIPGCMARGGAESGPIRTRWFR